MRAHAPCPSQPAAYVTASSAIPRSSRNAASISASVPGPYLDVVSRRTRLTRPPSVMLLSPRPRPPSAVRPSSAELGPDRLLPRSTVYYDEVQGI